MMNQEQIYDRLVSVLQSGYMNGTITSYKMYFSKRHSECCGFDAGDSGVGRSVDEVSEGKQMRCVILMPKFYYMKLLDKAIRNRTSDAFLRSQTNNSIMNPVSINLKF